MNPNLLQRSEVVALINTLHRFTESLVFVDEFRQMWARHGSHDKDELLRSLSYESPAAVFDGKVSLNELYSIPIPTYTIRCVPSDADQVKTVAICILVAEREYGRVGITSATKESFTCLPTVDDRLCSYVRQTRWRHFGCFIIAV